MRKNDRSFLVRSFFGTIRTHRILFLLLVLAVLGAVFFEIVPPLVLEELVDDFGAGVSDRLLRLAVLYFGLTALDGILNSCKEALITVFGQRVTHRIRSAMTGKLNVLPASYFVENDPGVITSRIVNDVDTLESLFSNGIISIVVDAGKLLLLLAAVFVRSRGLGWILLLALPFLFALTRFFKTGAYRAQLQSRVAVGRANRLIPETLANLRTVRLYGAEAFFERKYDREVKDGFDAVEKANLYDALFSPLVAMLRSVITACVLCLAVSGRSEAFGMTAGTAVALLSYIEKIFTPLTKIGMEITNIQTAAAGSRRICEFMEEEETVFDRSPVPDGDASVIASGVCFSYREGEEILKDFSLSVASGEFVTLTGRTGCGKSTFFKLLLGLYEPDSGVIRVCGIPPQQVREQDRRKVFGAVEQEFRPVPGTVFDQISLGEPDVTRERAEEVLSLTGLLETVERLEGKLDAPFRTEDFSQGQLQLLSIARAVVKEPRILLLDEITANLDSATEEQVLASLARASEGRTVLSISHRLYEKRGGRIICMDR